MKVAADTILGLPDSAPAYKWKISVAKFPNAGSFSVSSDELNARCISTDIPKITENLIDVKIRGYTRQELGMPTLFGQLNLLFNETVDSKVSDYYKACKQAYFNMKTGEQSNYNDVVQAIDLIRLNKQDQGIWRYSLQNVLVIDANFTPLSENETDLFRPTLILAYAKFEEGKL